MPVLNPQDAVSRGTQHFPLINKGLSSSSTGALVQEAGLQPTRTSHAVGNKARLSFPLVGRLHASSNSPQHLELAALQPAWLRLPPVKHVNSSVTAFRQLLRCMATLLSRLSLDPP